MFDLAADVFVLSEIGRIIEREITFIILRMIHERFEIQDSLAWRLKKTRVEMPSESLTRKVERYQHLHRCQISLGFLSASQQSSIAIPTRSSRKKELFGQIKFFFMSRNEF